MIAPLSGQGKNRNGAFPEILKFRADGIPASLKRGVRFCNWQQRWVDGEVKKPPIRSGTKKSPASTTEPKTWCTYGAAALSYVQDDHAGVGVMLGEVDGKTLGAVDLDGVKDPVTGEVEPRARQVLEDFSGTYAEDSPSKGLRIPFYVDDPVLIQRLRKKKSKGWGGKHHGIELGISGYVTLTGHIVGPRREVAICNEPVRRLLDQYWPEGDEVEELDDDDVDQAGDILDVYTDAMIVDRAQKAKSGDEFKRLWEDKVGQEGASGTWQDKRYASYSEAVFALAVRLLKWTCGDKPRTRRMFMSCALMRDDLLQRRRYGDKLDLAIHNASKLVAKEEKKGKEGTGYHWPFGYPKEDGNPPVGGKDGGRMATGAAGEEKPAEEVVVEPEEIQRKPFPIAELPEVVRKFVVEAALALRVPVEFVILPLLAALAGAVGNARRIRLKRTWCEPCVLWCVIVGKSGTRKSPSIDIVTRALRQEQRKAHKRYLEEMKVYRAAMAERNKKGGKKDVPLVAQGEPEHPILDQFFVSDTTVESLAVTLEQNPRGTVLIRDEISALFGGMNAYKKAKMDEANYLEMHRAGVVKVDRKGGPPLFVPHASLSIGGGIQPGPLGQILSRERFESGLVSRLLMAMPECQVGGWTEEDVDKETEENLNRVFHRLWVLPFGSDDEGNDVPVTVDLGKNAKRLWVRFSNEHAVELSRLGDDAAALWSKLEGAAARFGLLFHEIKKADDDPTLKEGEKIDSDTVRSGITVARWFGHEGRRIYQDLGVDEEGRQVAELVELIETDLKGRATARDLLRKRVARTAKEAREELQRLVDQELGEWEEKATKGGGHRVAVFVLKEGGKS